MMEASDNESLPGGGSETNHDEGDAGLAIEDISSSGLGRLREMEEKEGVLIYSTDNPQRGGARKQEREKPPPRGGRGPNAEQMRQEPGRKIRN